MTRRPLAAVPEPSGPVPLAERLAAVVRSEFRSEWLTFPADDPVFGGEPCKVVGCPHPARVRGLCRGHLGRWAKAGRPDLEVFAASTDPRRRRQRPVPVCQVHGCFYGLARRGVCALHVQQWDRAGRPDLAGWTAGRPAPPSPGATCRVEACGLWPQGGLVLCRPHHRTWKLRGRPDLDAFAASFTGVGDGQETVRLDALGAGLRLEMQYVLQCRQDDRAGRTEPYAVTELVRVLAATAATSLLDRTEESWLGLLGPRRRNARALLAYAHRKVLDLTEAGGWEAEYPRDLWRLRRLGRPGNSTLDFTGIGQPWLRELAKRWLRWRLSTDLHLQTIRDGLTALTRFAGFTDRTGVDRLAAVDRGVLERYLADLHAELAGRRSHATHVGQLSGFLRTVRQHGWDPTLPATALFFPEDYPRQARRRPRALPEDVMAQVEHPANLARWNRDDYRLISLVLMRCGLRVSDATRLRTDCLVLDADGAPYLRYFNHKMKREALVPIDEELHQMLADQRRLVGAAPVLFPRPTANPDRTHPVSTGSYRTALDRWLALCDVRDAAGQPAHLTPHQWRHTLGTRLINRDVPQEVVRRVLDHDSPAMTAHYARLHDTTVRRHWEAAHKVDVRGQQVHLDPDGPLADAAWTKQRLGRATQALPNGYCSLPVQKSCPHANACLTCPMFLTTAEFLPQHRGQRAQLLQLVSAAEARGQTRLAEMNQQVLTNLDQIITALDHEPAVPEDAVDAS